MKHPSSYRKGFALVLVLGIMLLLIVLVAGIAITVRSEVQVSASFADQTRARYLAYAGLQRALHELAQDNIGVDSYSDTWAELRSDDEGFDFEDGRFIVRVTDETGKLNLNTSDRTTLIAFLTQLTADSALAEELADEVIDWRDEDEEPQPLGAESDYYLSLSQPYRAKNAPFDSPYELLLVKGMTRETFYGDANLGTLPLPELVTAFSSSPNVDERGLPRVNINTATREQLQASLGDVLTEEEINAILRFRDGSQQQQQQSQTQFPSLPLLPQPPSGQPPQMRPPPPQGQLPQIRPQPPQGQPPQIRPQPGSPSPPRPSRGVPSESGTFRPPVQQPPIDRPQQQEGGSQSRPQQQQQQQRRQIRSLLDLQRVLPREKLIAVWERLTTTDEEMQYGLVNLNTAPPEVLIALTPDNSAVVDEILSYREQNGGFQSVGELLNIASLTQTELSRFINRVSVKSAVFRIRALGIVGNQRSVYLIDAIVERQPVINAELTQESAATMEQSSPSVQFATRYWRER